MCATIEPSTLTRIRTLAVRRDEQPRTPSLPAGLAAVHTLEERLALRAYLASQSHQARLKADA